MEKFLIESYSECKLIFNKATEYLLTMLYLFLYYIISFYTYIKSFFPQNSRIFKLIKIQLHKNATEYIEYKHQDLVLNLEPKYDFNFIKIDYTYNNTSYIIYIKTYNLKDLNKYYPPYKLTELEDINTNINSILSGDLVIDNEQQDITAELNKLAGPKGDFYKSVPDYNAPDIREIWGDDIDKINFLTKDVDEININSTLELY